MSEARSEISLPASDSAAWRGYSRRGGMVPPQGQGHNARVATPAFAGEDVDVLALLSDANRRRLLEKARDERYPAGAVAFGAGGSNRAFLLKRGLARTYWALADGRRKATTAFFYPGNLVGSMNLVPGHTAHAGPSARVRPGRRRFHADAP